MRRISVTKLKGNFDFNLSGNISIRGTGIVDTGDSRHGIFIDNSSLIQSTTGTTLLNGQGGGTSVNSDSNVGVAIENTSKITSSDGAISITGVGCKLCISDGKN